MRVVFECEHRLQRLLLSLWRLTAAYTAHKLLQGAETYKCTQCKRAKAKAALPVATSQPAIAALPAFTRGRVKYAAINLLVHWYHSVGRSTRPAMVRWCDTTDSGGRPPLLVHATAPHLGCPSWGQV